MSGTRFIRYVVATPEGHVLTFQGAQSTHKTQVSAEAAKKALMASTGMKLVVVKMEGKLG